MGKLFNLSACWLLPVNTCEKEQSTMLWSLQWRHNGHDGVSNHQPRGCLLNRLFRRRSKKTPKLRVTGLCVGNSPGPVYSSHKGPVTRKMFPFDDVIMAQFSHNCWLDFRWLHVVCYIVFSFMKRMIRQNQSWCLIISCNVWYSIIFS